jgi:hypothetical protein
MLKLVKMLDLRLAKFCELFIELRHYFGSFSDEMVVQGPHRQSFAGLSDDSVI